MKLNAPSVGSLTKRILTVNPDLSVMEIINILRTCTKPREDAMPGDFAGIEVLDEERAVEMARQSIPPSKNKPPRLTLV